jgi:hypothetical protein
MTKIYLILLLTFVGNNHLNAQTNFEIKSLGTSYSEVEINNAMLNAEWCKYYYSSERRELNFDDGAIVELKKQSELFGVDPSCVIEKNPTHDNNIWQISSSGKLIRRVPTVINK